MKEIPIKNLPSTFEAVTGWQCSYLTGMVVKVTIKDGKVIKAEELIDAPDVPARCSVVGKDTIEIAISQTKGKEYK